MEISAASASTGNQGQDSWIFVPKILVPPSLQNIGDKMIFLILEESFSRINLKILP